MTFVHIICSLLIFISMPETIIKIKQENDEKLKKKKERKIL